MLSRGPSVNCSLTSGRFSNFKNSVSLESLSKLEHVNKLRIIVDIVVPNRRLLQCSESSFLLVIAAKLRSGWLLEMSGYMEMGGYWQIRARVHPERGMNNYPKSGFIWSSEEDAKRDLPLFVWYKSSRKAGDMKVPQINTGQKWSVDTCPYAVFDCNKHTTWGRRLLKLLQHEESCEIRLFGNEEFKLLVHLEIRVGAGFSYLTL
jgi:hypothetical protein